MLTEIKKIKKGSYFTLRPGGRIYVRGAYDRFTKTYEYWPYDDCCNCYFAPSSFLVYR